MVLAKILWFQVDYVSLLCHKMSFNRTNIIGYQSRDVIYPVLKGSGFAVHNVNGQHIGERDY